MIDVPDVLKRAAEKSGFVRTRYTANNIVLDMSKIAVMVCFGDLRSTFLLSSLLLKRYREEVKGSKYFILCGLPGYECLFPYVDEYWAVKDESVLKSLFSKAVGLENKSELSVLFERNLNYFFEDVSNSSDILPYYRNGLTQEFLDRFKHIKRSLPLIPSSNVLGRGFNESLSKAGSCVMVYPVVQTSEWNHGRREPLLTDARFWVGLCNMLIEDGITPVVYQNFFTHDISTSVEGIYLVEKDVSKVLAAMRATGCVLDVFSEISCLAMAARCPFVACGERSRYGELKEYELDGLCCEKKLPREYIFSSPTIIRSSNMDLWTVNLFAMIRARLGEFLPNIDRASLPTTSETTEIVPYSEVRRKKMKKIGTKFIKVRE